MFAEDDLIRLHKGRADLIFSLILFSFVCILARLWYLQIYQGEILLRYSLENRLRKSIVKAPRGMVFSRNNQLLIYNVPRFDAIITPQYLKNKKSSLTKLSSILEMPLSSIERILKKNRGQAKFRPIVIKKNITRKSVAIIETESAKMPGVSVQTFISREYADSNVGSHMLGYISEISQTQLPKLRKRDHFHYKLGDFIGKAGLEQKIDFQLRGRDGHQFMEVDASGRMKSLVRKNLFKGVQNKDAKPGHNVRLTIDRDMQKAAFSSLEGKVGGAVAVDVNTGEVLAMVSRPSFDPAQFSKGLTTKYWNSLINNTKNPLRDRTIQDHYSPGSTFKTITSIAAMEEGIIDEKTEFICKGVFRLGRSKKHCWKRWGHGKVNLVRAIRESCDIFYYKIGMKLDIDVLSRYARLFGLGSKTGINLPRETTGLIPTREWKKKYRGIEWQRGETLSCVIGQSYVLATPIQLAMAYATLANGGTLYRPYLIKEIFSNSGEVVAKGKPKVVSRISLSDETKKYVTQGLYEVVNKRKGTAWWHRGSGLQMAGKTGTTQVIRQSAEKLFSKCEEQEYRFRNHGLFVSYAPADDPKIAVAVIVEHGCHGSSAAAPVAKAITTAYMAKYQPELRKMYKEKELKIYKKKLRLQKEKAAKEAIKKEAEVTIMGTES